MRINKGRIALTTVALAFIGAALVTPSSPRSATSSSPHLKTIQIQLPELSATQDKESAPVAEPDLRWEKFKVKKGDSMALIFRRAGEKPGTLHNIMSSGDVTERFKHLQVGQTIEFGYNEDDQFQELKFSPSKTQQLIVSRESGQWQPELHSEQVETRIQHATAVIKDSLFLSGSRAGLSDNTIMQLAGIFGWDIDFALDIRNGDQFSLIYETRHLDGEKIGDGEIIAAEFINQGKNYQAVRYTNPDNDTEYYSPDGRSMRKAFLRTPVKFSRISSRFTNKRWHPVLKRWRSHRGVDYAASRGTPVKATSNGKVTFKGRKGGYGKAIFLQHGKTYTTVYGHLKSYAKAVRKGAKVKQGQIIGYVGSTGLATGPHLHYELRVNGVHRNPLKVKLPKAHPIAKKYLQDFNNEALPLLTQLALINAAKFADANTGTSDKSLPN
ncbi:MAG: peptidoglycan DD-metalloendopeptidase family protein [Gammaproteobacteria bacterium]|nr:peptidoglycan DD-metalloendopeptidase family protein [Gammaproteobacteria bacterium]